VPDANPRERRRPGKGLSAFQLLETHARRLTRSIVLLIALVAVAPPLFYSIIEIRQYRSRAAVHAAHAATILELYSKMPQASAEGLQRHLRTERQHDDVASIQVNTAGGASMLIGDPPGLGLPTSAELKLPPSAAPFTSVRVSLHDEALLPDLRRILGVHILVALVLGVGVYLVPVRAFDRTMVELKSAQAQMVHSNRLSALGAMYAALTHEINNPLGILTARANLALSAAREKGLDAETIHDLEIIERQGGRIAEIIRSLLAFSRKAEFERRPVDLNAVVSEVVSLVERPFSKQGVRVQTELTPSLPPVQGSPEHLHQVLVNLVRNARDAMPDGGTLTLLTAHREGRVVVEVRDTGRGLSSEVREHLFEPFFTTKDVGEGTGLGLSVSHGIVAAHGGQIDAENAAGGGAVFRISLPEASVRP